MKGSVVVVPLLVTIVSKMPRGTNPYLHLLAQTLSITGLDKTIKYLYREYI